MRLPLMIPLALMPYAACAWEFSPEPICTLRHQTEGVSLTITHDPFESLYTLTLLQKDETWHPSARFGMAFLGGAELTIGTTRHQIEGPTLTVSDSGFGNVLNGLGQNGVALAFTDAQRVAIPLDGVEPALSQFRACPETLPATS